MTNNNYTQKYKRIVKWSKNPEYLNNSFQVYSVSAIMLIIYLIGSPFIAIGVWIKHLKETLKESRKIYYVRIK